MEVNVARVVWCFIEHYVNVFVSDLITTLLM